MFVKRSKHSYSSVTELLLSVPKIIVPLFIATRLTHLCAKLNKKIKDDLMSRPANGPMTKSKCRCTYSVWTSARVDDDDRHLLHRWDVVATSGAVRCASASTMKALFWLSGAEPELQGWCMTELPWSHVRFAKTGSRFPPLWNRCLLTRKPRTEQTALFKSKLGSTTLLGLISWPYLKKIRTLIIFTWATYAWWRVN